MKKYIAPEIELIETMSREFCDLPNASLVDGGGHNFPQLEDKDDFEE